MGKPDSNDDPDSSYRSPGVQWEQDTPAVTPDSPFPPDQQHPSPVPCGGSPLDDLCYGLTTVDVEPFLGSGGRRQLEHRTEQTAYVGTSAPSDKFTAATRQLLIDWAMLRQNRLRLSDSTLHLAIHLADELLALQVRARLPAAPAWFVHGLVSPRASDFRFRRGRRISSRTIQTSPGRRPGSAPAAAAISPRPVCPPALSPWRYASCQHWEAREVSTVSFRIAFLTSACPQGSNYHLQAPPFPLKLCRLVVTCLFVAAKLLEPQTRCPRAQEFAKEAASDHLGFGPQQLLVAEAFLLKVLNYCESPWRTPENLTSSRIASCDGVLTLLQPLAAIIRPTSSCFVGAFFSGLRKGVASDGIRKGLRRAAGLAPKPPKKKFGSGLDNATLAERLDVARYLLDIALHSHATLKMQRSELAAAAFWLACSAACEGRAAAKLTKQQFERLTGYRVRDISPYAEFLASLFRDAQKYPHLYVHRKHSRTRECAASLLHVKPS